MITFDIKHRLIALAAERIYRKVQTMGPRQVRIHHGMFLTYPFPAPRGYGTRGVMVGIYGLTSRKEWIEDDILALLSDS